MNQIAAIVISILTVSLAIADPIDLTIRTETGNARAKLLIGKHAQDGQTYLAFSVPTKKADGFVNSLALLDLNQRDAAITAFTDAAAKLVKAANAVKTTESSETLWNPTDDLTLILYQQSKFPRAYAELAVDTTTFVLRTKQDFDKLIAAIKAVK